MIFHNPSGAPELACEQCGCRWFDRMHGTCYECGSKVSAEAIAEFDRALQAFWAKNAGKGGPAAGPGARPPADA